MTITAPIIRALEHVVRRQPVAPAMRTRLVDERLAEEDQSATTSDVSLRITDIGKAILQAYRLGRRRWGAS